MREVCPFLRILAKEQDHAATTSRAELLEAEAAKIKQERKKTMKAQIEKYQKALDEFLKNEFWRELYETAPNGAKGWLEAGFDASVSGGMGGPRCRAAANWESRLPGGAFPPRPS